MRIKDNSIRFVEMHVNILKILPYVEMVYQQYGEEPVITSCKDGNHMKGSKHYTSRAIDFRTRYFNEQTIDLIIDELRILLGRDFDVLKSNNCLHIEEQNYKGTLKDINNIREKKI